MEDILWGLVAFLTATTFLFMVITEYWCRQCEFARNKLAYLEDRMNRSVTEQATMKPGVSVTEFKKQTDAQNRKARPGYETNCLCPKCGCFMFRYLQSSVSNSRGRLFCRSCPHEEEL